MRLGGLRPAEHRAVIQTLGLAALWLVFLAAFSLATGLTRALHDPLRQPPPMGRLVGVYAATLLPIAAGYLIAHYLTLVIQGVVWLPELMPTHCSPWRRRSTGSRAAWSGTCRWAVVVGHIVAVVLAHRIALRDSPSRPVLAGLPWWC